MGRKQRKKEINKDGIKKKEVRRKKTEINKERNKEHK